MGYAVGQIVHHSLYASFEVEASGAEARGRYEAEHPGWELNFLPSAGSPGRVAMELRGREFVFRPDRLLLFNGEERHTESYAAAGEAGDRHRVDALVLFPNFLASVLAPLGLNPAELVFEGVELSPSPRLRRLLAALMALRGLGDASPFSFDCLATELVAGLAAEQAHTQSRRLRERASSGHFPGPITRAKRVMAERALDDSLALDSLAAASGMSKFHFVRSFRARTGQSPAAYLNRLRVDLARIRLRRGASVTEAALASGFASLSTFQKAFRRHTGYSAAAYKAGL